MWRFTVHFYFEVLADFLMMSRKEALSLKPGLEILPQVYFPFVHLVPISISKVAAAITLFHGIFQFVLKGSHFILCKLLTHSEYDERNES